MREKNLSRLVEQQITLNAENSYSSEKIAKLEGEATQNQLEIATLKSKVEAEEYEQGQHALKILYNYSDIALLFTFIKNVELKMDEKYKAYKRVRVEKNIPIAYEVYIKEQDESLKMICEKIAELMARTFYEKTRSVTVSIFTCYDVKSEPVALKQCSAYRGSGAERGMYYTDGRSYPVKNNSDFMKICERFSKSDQHSFFCCGNLPNEDYYLDSNHEHHRTGIFHYKKGGEYKLHYKSLISSAIFDVNIRSNDAKNINGFLSVSSPSVACFTRSDTLLLQVISAQLHDLCVKINNRTNK